MTDKFIKSIMEENQKLRNENIILRGRIRSLDQQIQELKSDKITEKAIQRDRP
jgi:regulator of replication initiation timing